MDSTARTRIPDRHEIPDSDKWNLSGLFPGDDEWEAGFAEFMTKIPEVEQFRGTLGLSVDHLLGALEFMAKLGQLEERLGSYAHLRLSEDAGDSKNQERFARYMQAATQMEALSSYQSPEIQAVPPETMDGFLKDEKLAEFRIQLGKLLRYRPHILTEKEERLLAMQEESNQTARKTFSALTDVDMEFGTITTPEGERPLSQASYGVLLLHPEREVRKAAFSRFMGAFTAHKNTLASLYGGSVQLDVYRARVRNFASSRASHLFADDVPESVYDNLVQAVHDNLPALHRYYAVRKRVLGVAELHLYDVKVPLVPNILVKHSYDAAVDLVGRALAPLGEEYVNTLTTGLRSGWADRYENKGKRSGAFSAGSYTGDPYLLLNFNDDDLRDVFTMAHEGGHSMHSWFSVRNNQFQNYQYTIFEAEVASTFNEQLLLHYLLEQADDEGMKSFLINKQIDDIIGTLYRQTMFAEYEKITHEMVESGSPLTVASLRSSYRELLETYFGPDVVIDQDADMEGLRIPHFYRAFYVYKYATGISAAIALSQKVLNGGAAERDAYFSFLRSGGSRFPIESLRMAGVDMEKPDAIRAALKLFSTRVDELERSLETQAQG